MMRQFVIFFASCLSVSALATDEAYLCENLAAESGVEVSGAEVAGLLFDLHHRSLMPTLGGRSLNSVKRYSVRDGENLYLFRGTMRGCLPKAYEICVRETYINHTEPGWIPGHYEYSVMTRED